MHETLPERLTENVLLSHYTSWRVGGPAQYFFQPQNKEDVVDFLRSSPADAPIFWLGLGSNLLIRDGGLPGTVISTLEGLNKLEQTSELIVRAEAGVPCAKVARFCSRLGLEGAEFLAGIPGSMGGALAMNAGCFAAETWEIVESVETVTRDGQLLNRNPADFKVAYRQVQRPGDEYFIAGNLKLRLGSKEIALEKIRELLDRRAKTQPTGDYSCGSVFRNPPGDYAARLIEACGLKGKYIGGACVSEKHANFIVNANNATAQDIESLIEEVAATVKAQHGIELIKEVKIVGIK